MPSSFRSTLSVSPAPQFSGLACMRGLHLMNWLRLRCFMPRNISLHDFFFVFLVGELFITHTFTCSERSHKCQTEGHPQPKLQATLTTWVEADIKVCQEATCQAKQAAYKAVVHQPTAKPVHFQQTKHHLCLNRPNIAVKITSILKCQAEQAADKTVVHHQYAKLAFFH